MNTIQKRAQNAIPVLQDIVDGYLMQYRAAPLCGWGFCEDPALDLVLAHPERYRRKPEPEEIWVNKGITAVSGYTHSSKKSAERAAMGGSYDYVAKRFVEADEGER